jgi:hypothetical protein
VSYRFILDSGNLEDIQDHMIEEAMGRDWSVGSFTKRVEKLQAKFGVNLGFKKQILLLFDEANLLRNCILHTGSKISPDYAQQFGKARKAKKGDQVSFNSHFAMAITYLSRDWIKDLFMNVSASCWGSGHREQADNCICGIHNFWFREAFLNPQNEWHKVMRDNGVFVDSQDND